MLLIWVMQLQLPLFPSGTTMISDCLGVYEQDGLVQYIVNGLPVYAHPKEELKAFRLSKPVMGYPKTPGNGTPINYRTS